MRPVQMFFPQSGFCLTFFLRSILKECHFYNLQPLLRSCIRHGHGTHTIAIKFSFLRIVVLICSHDVSPVRCLYGSIQLKRVFSKSWSIHCQRPASFRLQRYCPPCMLKLAHTGWLARHASCCRMVCKVNFHLPCRGPSSRCACRWRAGCIADGAHDAARHRAHHANVGQSRKGSRRRFDI